MAKLQTLPADTTTETIVERLRRDGALILDRLVDDDTLARLRDELLPVIEQTPDGSDDFSGRRTTRTGGLVTRSAACRELVMHPAVLAAAGAFLEPYCTRFQLHLTQVIRLRPGQGEQMIHRDRWAWGTYLQGVEPQCNTIWALTDFTAANGATRVAPGSVDWPDDRRPTAEEICQAEMTAGSVLLYSGSVFHGGGENRSDADRMGINITYSLGWLRQEENQYLSCPPELARQYPPELQDLLGYTQGSYALGYYTPPDDPGGRTSAPEYALGRGKAGVLGDDELLQATIDQTRSREETSAG